MKNEEIEDLMLEIALMHKAALYYAGVKENCLEKAAFAYLELIDEVDCEDDFELIIKTMELLKKKHPEFFNN
ncbi:hypothetical protein AVANS_0458 [Campylobacter sp. RM5004]|uniref:hypothetical protein n=1 Tax=Campylobacter sp. RM5004 TaxID=1660078 RepID=UPI001EFA421D|nr:hypothetical protein [Campylobacter sp. RM5004]ULO01095.1 hypothetical protein AVANS_0458 [Campylobacter sp. RM5004]